MASFRVWLRKLFSRKEEPGPDLWLPQARPQPSGPKSFDEDSNDFALVFYGKLQQPGNLIFSPFSIRCALAMAHSGARGETATQMRQALRFASTDEALRVAFAEIIRSCSPSEIVKAARYCFSGGLPIRRERKNESFNYGSIH